MPLCYYVQCLTILLLTGKSGHGLLLIPQSFQLGPRHTVCRSSVYFWSPLCEMTKILPSFNQQTIYQQAQAVDIPIGTSCIPLLAALYLVWHYQYANMQKLLLWGNPHRVRPFAFTQRCFIYPTLLCGNQVNHTSQLVASVSSNVCLVTISFSDTSYSSKTFLPHWKLLIDSLSMILSFFSLNVLSVGLWTIAAECPHYLTACIRMFVWTLGSKALC